MAVAAKCFKDAAHLPMHTCIYTYIHTYIHTYTPLNSELEDQKRVAVAAKSFKDAARLSGEIKDVAAKRDALAEEKQTYDAEIVKAQVRACLIFIFFHAFTDHA